MLDPLPIKGLSPVNPGATPQIKCPLANVIVDCIYVM